MLSLVESEQYGSVLKAVIETPGKTQEVIEGLSKLIEERTADIQEICSTFYQDFFGSVDDLAAVRSAVEKIRSQLEELTSESRRASAEFSSRSKAYLENKAMSENSGKAKAIIEQCLRLSLLMDEIRRLCENGNLCEAVSSVDKARISFVNPLSHVPLVQHIALQLPKCSETIRKQASIQFNDWLSRAWACCSIIGEIGFHSAEISLKWRKQLTEKTRAEALAFRSRISKSLIPIDSLSSPQSRSLHLANQSNSNSKQSSNEIGLPIIVDPTASNTLDFTALYQAVFVFKKQGRLQELREQYSETKRLQVMKIFQAQPNGETNLCSSLLKTLAGFFMIEHSVLSTAHELLSPSSLEELWRLAIGKCKAVILNELSSAKTTNTFSITLDSAALFAETLHLHRYDVTPVLDFLPESSHRYAEIAFEEFATSIDNAFKKNTWDQLTVSSAQLLEEKVLQHNLPCSNLDDSNRVFPQTLAFSPVVPEFCSLVKSLILHFFSISDRLGDIERLVTKTVDQSIQRFIRLLSQRPPKDNYKMAAQLLADLYALTGIPRLLEKFIQDRCTWGHIPSLEISRRILEGAQQDSEGAIKTAFQARFDMILAPKLQAIINCKEQSQSQQSQFVEEVKTFCVSVKDLLSGVTNVISQSIIVSSLKRVSETIISALMSDQIKKIPYTLLLSLQSDCMLFEQYSASLGYSNTNPAVFFSQILVVIRSLLKPDIVQLVELSKKQGIHPVIADLSLLASLLDKVKEDKSSPTNYSKSVKTTLKSISQMKH